ncbi:hypothetical protein QBC37DRAFT_465960 [Rhypophila decipiens]|uniref:Uncharacterized protein n=1 Tax=Rhypophila decipiens TaxID=261697 RepID=A0AAN6Y421_9PEZI|nr:hypothetical protein QBC37DRAFT_465960 [Rhypophila decipiens]
MSGHPNAMEALLKSFLPDEMQSTMRSNGISINELIKEMGDRALDHGAKAEHVSLDDARRQTEPMRAKILELYGTLGDIVARHEATIQKRWAKKTRGERLLILLRAWPDMPRKHRPDFNAFKDEHGLVNKAKRPQWRAKTLCPTINQEDLLKPRTLPLLLNSRARNHPSVFAGTDRMEMTIGLRTFALVPSNVKEHVMLLNRITESTSQDYGKIVRRSMDGSTGSLTTTPEKQYSVGEGALILESQQMILAFLVDTCRAILLEIAPDKMTGPECPILPEPKLKEESESAGFESLTVMAQEAPYRLPAHLDTARMISLLSARTQAAKDHLWSLREDPRYFHETLLEYADHRNEYFWGNSDGTNGRRVIYWPDVLRQLLADAYVNVESFDELRRQAIDLQSLHAKYSDQIDPSKDLPREYMDALVKFRTYLWQTVSNQFTQLKDRALCSPQMRHLFEYSTEEETIVSNPARINDVESVILWLFKTLYDDEEPLRVLGLTMVMDQLEYVISTDPNAKALISSTIGQTIGDLSILAQCYRQLELYQPWAQEFELHAAKAPGKLADPAGGRFTYPVDKRRTKENVEKMRKAEENLDAFWRSIDRLTHVKLPGMQGTVSGPFLAQSHLLKRTPEWVEPAETSTTSAKKFVPQDQSFDKPLSPFYSEFSSTPRRPELPAGPKAKTKTKGAANPPAATENTTTTTAAAAAGETIRHESSAPQEQKTWPVDARAFKVFRTLFFNPDVTSSPGEIAWKDFLHAMASVGFVAEKLYGSVWQFKPTKLDVEQPIQFHEPHPSPKMGITTARRIGRRLFRQYGLVGSMIVLNK